MTKTNEEKSPERRSSDRLRGTPPKAPLSPEKKKSPPKTSPTKKGKEQKNQEQDKKRKKADNEVEEEEKKPPVSLIPRTPEVATPVKTDENSSLDLSSKKQKLSRKTWKLSKVFDGRIFWYDVVSKASKDIYEEFKTMNRQLWTHQEAFVETFADLAVMSAEEVDKECQGLYKWVYRVEPEVNDKETSIPVNAKEQLEKKISSENWFPKDGKLVLRIRKGNPPSATWHDWIEIRKTTDLEQSGYGVFALRTFSLRTPVSLFAGVKKEDTKEDTKKVRYETKQMICKVLLPGGETELRVATINNVDVKTPEYPLYLGAQYINTCSDIKKNRDMKIKQNVQIGNNGMIVAMRKILTGEQIFLGEDYRDFSGELKMSEPDA